MNNKRKTGDKPKEKQITEKRRIGNLGEYIGCIYLEKQGYKIKDRNYLKKYGEIDIVAEKDKVIHFIEVKTVTRRTGIGLPREASAEWRAEDNVHPWKLRKLSRVIQAYILDKRVRGEWQFDVMTVVLHMETRRARVKLMENIVL